MERTEYSKSIFFNERFITRVIIDQHYKESHPEISDEIILKLVETLNHQSYPPKNVKHEYEYFKVEPIYLDQKPYRLIFLLQFGKTFLGVINAFRVSGEKDMKEKKWPSKKEIESVLKEMENTLGSRPLHPNASSVDKIKFDLCEQFVLYLQRNKITQKEMSQRIGVDPALLNKIIHYHFDEFTIDRLVRFLELLDKSLKVKITAA